MSLSDRQQRAREIFLRALECSEEQREVWLREECAGDEELVAAVRLLLEKEEQATLPGGGHDIQSGSCIGPYTLRQPIGEGGFAEVFLAEQKEPVRRRVALKVLKPGMDSREVLARFEAERQALALMQHPGIARILDAGITDNGRSWFAMEYVEGVPLTEYCDTHRLNLRERLELFTGICEAVQHAHQKGIIHRDLKPSNILVGLSEGKPRAKVIDFGIAKAAGPRLTEKTLFTAQGMLVGTPAYMSPEQAEMSGVDVDTRSDVYSLGILLYELLSGEPPFHPRRLLKAGYGEIQRIIREEEPQRPSTKSTTIGEAGRIARARQLNVTTLRKRLDGDLDWIAMKALEKDRTRRYATVQELSADLGRHLANEPVAAGPPGVRYRLVKFVRRNRAGVAAAAMVLAALGAGIATTTWQWQQARKAEQVAVAEREKVSIEKERLEKMVEFQEGILTGLDANKMGLTLMRLFREGITGQLTRTGRTPQEIEEAIGQFNALAVHANPTDVATDLLDEEILESAVATIDREITGDPVTEARLRTAVAEVYFDLGLYDKAQALVEHALALLREHLGNDHPDTMSLISGVGTILAHQGKHVEAESYFRELLESCRRLFGDEDPDTLIAVKDLGVTLKNQLKLKEAEPYIREALEGLRRALGDEDLDTLSATNVMGDLLRLQANTFNEGEHHKALEKYKEAESYYREVQEVFRRVLGNDHPDTQSSIRNLSSFLLSFASRRGGSAYQRVLDEAELHFRELLKIRRRVLGDEHPLTLSTLVHLSVTLSSQGEFEEAETYRREWLEAYRSTFADDHPNMLYQNYKLGRLLKRAGKFDEAETLAREALKLKPTVKLHGVPGEDVIPDPAGHGFWASDTFGKKGPYPMKRIATLTDEHIARFGELLKDIEIARKERETQEKPAPNRSSETDKVLAPRGVDLLWTIETVDVIGKFGGLLDLPSSPGYTSLSHGPDGYPAISYWDYKNKGLKYAAHDGKNWIIQTVDSEGDVGRGCSLSHGPDGYPAISYWDYENKDLKYATHDGERWIIQTVDSESDVRGNTSLSHDPDGYPAISYWDYENKDLKYAAHDGKNWIIQTVDSEGDVGRGCSLSHGLDGHPAISYQKFSNRSLKYAVHDGENWTTSTVEKVGEAGSGWSTSLSHGPDGHPAITHMDADHGNLKYAAHNGRNWVLSTVESTGQVGWYNSLRHAPSGRPAISYYDFTNHDLKYAAHDGERWIIQTVDSEGDVGEHTSLSHGPDGYPAISYWDFNNGALKIAIKRK